MSVLSHLIVFEGIDGSGTTTQIGMALPYLQRSYKSHRFVADAEPNQTDSVVPLRRYLSNPPIAGTLPTSQLFSLLFCADRVVHLQKIPWSSFVLEDRFTLSTLAYQAHQDDAAHRRWVENVASIFPIPGLTILIDVDPDLAMRRVIARERKVGGKAREVYETIPEQRRVRDGYNCYFSQLNVINSPAEVVVGCAVRIDGSGSKKKIAEVVKQYLDAYMGLFKQADFFEVDPAKL